MSSECQCYLDICHLKKLNNVITVDGPNNTLQFQLYDSSVEKKAVSFSVSILAHQSSQWPAYFSLALFIIISAIKKTW